MTSGSRMPALTAAMAGLALLAACPCTRSSQPGPASPAPWQELFEDQDWNDLAPGTGTIFSGAVLHEPGSDAPSFVMRYNPWKLRQADGTMLDIYCGTSDVLSTWEGMDVEIEGRLESMEIEGTPFVEIWPARIRPVAGTRDTGGER